LESSGFRLHAAKAIDADVANILWAHLSLDKESTITGEFRVRQYRIEHVHSVARSGVADSGLARLKLPRSIVAAARLKR
jgi:hypothetical protein